ncbi:serpin-ZX-like [Rutidosis leptorrhynchoides]|uniref:serpin-ZX-like n=1 Tax=Rutidosis leptorrhynchoides TaxID=125765 RepID=UPI003A99B5FE
MDIHQFIKNQTHVSTTLANTLLTTKSNNSNFVFSPLSIHVVLGLIVAGSKGQTLNQLLSFLKTNTIDDLNALLSQIVSWVLADGSLSGGPQLSYANGVWVKQTLSLKPSFKQVADTVFNAFSSRVDFKTKAAEVAKEENLWVEKQTNSLIKDILPAGAVNNSTRLIFANAIYFKGAWGEKFDPSKTKDFDFHLLDGSKVQVPFMIEFGFEASEVLKELGLVLPFSGEEGLTEIVDSIVGQDLYVSSIYHKSFVEVNEEGTEAAAASAYAEAFRSRYDYMVDFVADHPFLFVIRDDISGVVLFIGQVIDPSVSSM